MGSPAIRVLSGVSAPRLLFCFLIAAAGGGRPVLALDPARSVTQYVHEVWGQEDGLPQGSIEAITQTRDGYLWLGTYQGLARFDGVRFTVFDKYNSPAMTHNHVRALCEDQEGRLWIGTWNGVAVLEEGRFRGVPLPEGYAESPVTSMLCDPEGAVWIGTRDGLLRWKDDRFTSRRTADGLPADSVNRLLRDKGGVLWIGTRGGLARLRDGRVEAVKDDRLSDRITCLQEDLDGGLWVGTGRGGLYRAAGKRLDGFERVAGLPDERIWAIHQDRAGSLWVGTSTRGIMRLSGGRWEAFTAKDGLSFEVVISIYEDREGGLWIGTDGGGLNRLRDGNAVTFTTREGLPNALVWSVFEDRRGDLWLGTAGGLVRYREGRFTPFTIGLSSSRVHVVGEDGRGDLWVGTSDGGLFRFRDGSFTRYRFGGRGSASVTALCPDPSGGLWIGSTRGGLSLLRDGALRTYTTKDGLPHDNVRALLRGRHGDLWIGTDGGLGRFRGGGLEAYTSRDGLPHEAVLDIHEDPEGVLWIGTYGGGLARFEGGHFDVYDQRSGLPNDAIYRVLEDGADRLWLTSNKGIFQVAKRDLEAFRARRLSSVPFVAYGRSDGVRGGEVSGFTQPAGWRSRDGRLWFPMIKGLAVIDPSRITRNGLSPPAVIEQVLVDRTPIPPGGSPRFPPEAREYEFHYTGLSLLEPPKVSFKYKLEGFDREWIEAGARRRAYYTNIPPGSYRLRVLASNNDGVWSPSEASFAFAVAPRFRDTVWFYLLCGGAILAVAGGAHRLHEAKIRRRERTLARLVEERTRDLLESQGRLQKLTEDLEERVHLSAAALAEKERMATYGHLVGAVAHEIRNPIFALRSAIHVVGERLSALPEMQAPLRTIEKVSERLSALTSSLLEFGRPQTLTPALVRPRRLLEEVASAYRAECPSGAPVLAVECGDDLPEVRVDGHQMVQALLNLVHNARQHARGASTVTLSAALLEPTAESQVGRISLTVRDDGAGIAEDDLPWIFEPFFTTENGTGLGLAIVRRIVGEHGGTIQVASPPGQGALFTLCIPLPGAAAPDALRGSP